MNDIHSPEQAPEIQQNRRYQPLAPVLPIHSEWEDYRLKNTLHIEPPPQVEWDTGRYEVDDKMGNTHIFHDHHLSRRNSWNVGSYGPVLSLPPHRMRMAFRVPLSAIASVKEEEKQRRRWFKRKVRQLEKVIDSPKSAPLVDELRAHYRDWSRSACMHSACSLQSHSYEGHVSREGVPWHAPDLTNETLFTNGPWRHPSSSQTPGDVEQRSRRFSCDDHYYALDSEQDYELPFLRELRRARSVTSSSMVYVRRTRSYDTGETEDSFFDSPAASIRSRSFGGSEHYRSRESMVYAHRPGTESEAQSSRHTGQTRNSRAHSSTDSEASNASTNKKSPSAVVVGCVLICAAIFNIFCFCGPCVQLFRGWTKARKWYRAWSYERRKNHNDTVGSSESSHHPLSKPQNELYSCPQCDHHLRREAETRNLWTVRPPPDQSRLPRPARRRIPKYHDLPQVLRVNYTKSSLKWVGRRLLVWLKEVPGFKDASRLLAYRVATMATEMEALKRETNEKVEKEQEDEGLANPRLNPNSGRSD